MSRVPALICLTLAGAPALSAAPAPGETVLYVAPEGRDTWSGKLPEPNAARSDGPLATLAGARDAVRRLKARQGGTLKTPVTVAIRGGLYLLPETVTLTPEDSGTAACPVTYAAYRGERPVLSGGRSVTNWKPDRDGLWKAEVPWVTDRESAFRQLFLARPGQGHFSRRYRPTRGFFLTAGATDAPYKDPKGIVNHRNSQDEFHYARGDIEAWPDLEDVELVAMHDWSSGRFGIREIDAERRIVRLTEFPHYRIGAWYPGGRNPYYLENLREDLGKPGEWYLDRKAKVLYYKPLPGEDMRTLTVIAPSVEVLVKAAGTREPERALEHVRFRGLTFAHAAWKMAPHKYAEKHGRGCRQGFVDMPAAVELQWAKNCLFERCDLSHNGSYGLDLGEGCHDNRVVGCRFVDNATGGVKVGTVDRGAKPPLVPTGNQILNCVVSDTGVVHYSGHGIWGGICAGTRIAHNVVRRTFYSPVAVGWDHSKTPTACRDNVMEYNHIYDVMLLLDHGGALYTLGNQPGTVMRGNLIHDTHHTFLHGKATKRPDWAGGPLGLDDGSSGFVIEENVTYNTAGNPDFTTARDQSLHTWRNNSFGVPPTDPQFPKEIAARAGLEPQYRDLLAGIPPVTAPPVLALKVPEYVGGLPITDDFERIAVGEPSKKAYCRLEGKGADSITVTDEAAAEGRHSLKVVDAPGLSREWVPYLSYNPGYRDGAVTVSFHARVEAGAILEHSWRGRAPKAEFAVGPSLRLADGKLTVGDQVLMEIPVGQWARFEIKAKLGAYDPGIGAAGRRTDVWDLTVTPAGGAPRAFPGLKIASPDFQDLNWVGFVSLAKDKTVIYLDDVQIRNE